MVSLNPNAFFMTMKSMLLHSFEILKGGDTRIVIRLVEQLL